MTERTYVFDAKIIKHRDGDTVEVDIDLGLYAHLRAALRLRDVDTPEMVGPDRARGQAAKAYLESVIPVGSVVRIQTFKRRDSEKFAQTFDRFVAEIWTADGRSVSSAMRGWMSD